MAAKGNNLLKYSFSWGIWTSLPAFALWGWWEVMIFYICTISAGEKCCRFVSMGRKDKALLFWTKHFKASGNSHPVQVKPNAPCHCYPLTFIHTISVLLIFCVIIWKYLDCYYEKQGTRATSSSGLHSQNTNQNTPSAQNLSLCPEAVDSHRFVSNV